MKNTKVGILQLCFLISLFILISCENIQTNDRDAILECIIDNYTSINKVTKTDYLSISDFQNWSDSTSIIMLVTLPKEENYELDEFTSEYNGIEIRMSRGSLNKSKKVVDELWIPTNIKWRKKKDKAKAIDESDIPIGNNPPQIQLIYNPKNNCIQEIILGNSEIISQTMMNCKKCN